MTTVEYTHTSTSRSGLQYLTAMFFEKEATEKACLLSLLMVNELILHWIWVVVVYVRRSALSNFVNTVYLFPLGVGCSFFIVLFCLFARRFLQFRDSSRLFFKYQVALIATYTLYNIIAALFLGQNILVSGVSVIGGAVLGMMLIDRRVVWIGFLIQCIFVTLFAFSPYLFFDSPLLRLIPNFLDSSSHHHVVVNSVAEAEHLLEHLSHPLVIQSHLFWRLSYVYLSLPKAIMIVFIVKLLLESIEYRKALVSHEAAHDPLTGIKNRRSISQFLKYQALSDHHHSDLSVIMVDLDHFKTINDKYGHTVGDTVLKKVAAIFEHELSNIGAVGRYGGEEFLLVIPNCYEAQAISIAQELRIKLAQNPLIVDEMRLNITASFGVASITRKCLHAMQGSCYKSNRSYKPNQSMKALPQCQSEQSLKKLIDNADKALYQAKYHGRNRVMWVSKMGCNCINKEPSHG